MKAVVVVCAAALSAAFAAPAAAQPSVLQSIVVSGMVLPACRAGQSQVLSQQGRIIRLDTGGICRNHLGYEVSLSRSEALAGAIIILDGQVVGGTPQSQSGEGRDNGAPASGTPTGTLGLKISPKL